jgi:hypothetical protein
VPGPQRGARLGGVRRRRERGEERAEPALGAVLIAGTRGRDRCPVAGVLGNRRIGRAIERGDRIAIAAGAQRFPACPERGECR